MSQHERTGKRCLIYSRSHRADHIGQYIGYDVAETIKMIDIDSAEYDQFSEEAVSLIETAWDNGQQRKKETKVTRKLAKHANIPCFTTLYTPSDPSQPDLSYATHYSVRRDFIPNWTQKYAGWPEWKDMKPQEYADFLVELRVDYRDRFDRRQVSDLFAAWARAGFNERTEFLNAVMAVAA